MATGLITPEEGEIYILSMIEETPSSDALFFSCGSDNRRDYVLGTINENGLKQVVSMKETCAAYVVQHRHHRRPKTLDVHQDHRLTVLPKLGPGHDFHDFFDGTDATRKCHEMHQNARTFCVCARAWCL